MNEPAHSSDISNNEFKINLRPQKIVLFILLFCLSVELLLALADWFIHFKQLVDYSSIRKIFNVAKESSLGTWFNVIQTFIIGCIAWIISLCSRQLKMSRLSIVGWFLSGCFFVYLSADDAAELHERISPFIRSIFSKGGSNFFEINPSYNWQMVFLPLFAIFGILLLFFLKRELKKWSKIFIVLLSFAIMACAVSLDFIEGLDKNHKYNLITIIQQQYHLKEYTVAHTFRLLEETLEMISMTLLLYVFLNHLFLIISSKKILISFQNEETDKE